MVELPLYYQHVVSEPRTMLYCWSDLVPVGSYAMTDSYDPYDKSNYPLDLGSDHYGKWYSWAPDRKLNPQYKDIPDIDRVGLEILHQAKTQQSFNERHNGWCLGSVLFNLPELANSSLTGAKWNVSSFDPLTISPSVLCGCGDHGFITNGRWVSTP